MLVGVYNVTAALKTVGLCDSLDITLVTAPCPLAPKCKSPKYPQAASCIQPLKGKNAKTHHGTQQLSKYQAT